MIKRLIYFLVLFFLPFFSFATKYTTTTGLNMRSGIGKNESIVYTLDKGAEVQIISKHKNWYKVNFQGNVGYVNSIYLTPSTASSSNNLPSFLLELLKIIALLTLIYLIIKLCKLIYKKQLINQVIYRIIKLIRWPYQKRLIQQVTQIHRGTSSERQLVLQLLRFGFPKEHIFHDLLINGLNLETSQTDLLVISEVGIIVFEVKDYKGWIYGAGATQDWSQVLNYGKNKYRIFNPIKQNNSHIEALKNNLKNFPNIPYYSVIAFFGDCILKDIKYIPQNIYVAKSARIDEAINSILNTNNKYDYEDLPRLIEQLNQCVLRGGNEIEQQIHIQNIRDMLGSERIYH